jgi:dihydroorotate dehydrogenase (NAD+) catalytic subunit
VRIVSSINPDRVDTRFCCGPVEVANPVFTASGTWGYGIEFLDLVDAARLGGIVTKTITVEARPGNPQPRVRELRHGMLNSIGLENVGLESFVRDKLPVLREHGVATVVSLAARDESEFVTMITELARHDGWNAVELNLSCPNVARGGLDFGREPGQVERIARLASESLPDDRALWVKLTPNVTSIGELAAGAERGGAHAISCINTVVGMEIDLRSREPVFPRATAGYSGPAILPIALAKVWEVAHAVSIPIVGIGGIGSLEDVLRFLVAGASAVQVGTSLFARPDLANRFVAEFVDRLALEGVSRPGALRSSRLPDLGTAREKSGSN